MKQARQTPAEDTAQYIVGMARELKTLAANAKLDFLAYLLSMVEQEAASMLQRDTPSSPAATRGGPLSDP